MVAARDVRRPARHLFHSRRQLRRCFTAQTLSRIEAAIRESERLHRAELRFVVEGGLDVMPVWQGLTPRDRAIELFSQLRVWDTAENSGVLIYVQLADRDIEIVADRGVAAKVGQAQWEAVCRRMEAAFRESRYEAGSLEGLAEITALLALHFPAQGANPDELPDAPLILPGG